MKNNRAPAPILKWVGGKRQLLDALAPLLPRKFSAYCEPFLGGGAMLFHLRPARAYVNDINAELINLYEVVRDSVEQLIQSMQVHINDSAYFYQVRDWDRDDDRYRRLSPVERASRMLYLNKTCYNGLFRVNAAGKFNTPFGRYKNPNLVNAEALRSASRYLRAADIFFSSTDYAEVLEKLPKKSFVYLDPPYHPVSTTANFTSYTRGGFAAEQQIRLKACCDRLNSNGIAFMLSNSAADFVKELYADYNIVTIQAKRYINSVSSRRGDVEEMVVRNYE